MRIHKFVATLACTSALVVTAVVPTPAVIAADQPNTLAAAQTACGADLASLNGQASDLQKQIDEVNGQISEQEAKLAELKAQAEKDRVSLLEVIRQTYVSDNEDQLSAILASSNSLVDVLGQEEGRNKISDAVAGRLAKYLETKKNIDSVVESLQKKRDGLTSMQANLQGKIDTAVSQKQTCEQLAQMKESQYQQAKQALSREEIGSVAAPQNSGGGYSGGYGGVSGDNPYTPGQCTWYVYNVTHRGQWGNAGQWPGGGSRRVGGILIMPAGVGGAGGVGHVGIIIGFESGGIKIRDMNWAGPYRVTEHVVPDSSAYRYF